MFFHDWIFLIFTGGTLLNALIALNSPKHLILFAFNFLFSLFVGWKAAADPSIIYSKQGPEHARLCSASGYPKSKNFVEDCNMIGSLSAMSSLFPNQRVKSGNQQSELFYKAPASAYEKRLYGLAKSLISSHPATSLIVWVNGNIIFEAYQYGRTDKTKFASFSMQKSLLGQLVGIAIDEGKISSLSDKVTEYYPALADTGWSEVSILQALTMTSAMPADQRGLLVPILFRNQSVTNGLKGLSKPTGKHGVSFRYNDANSLVLGKVIEGAYKQKLAVVLSRKIWSKIGAESDATVLTNNKGEAVSSAFFNARSRDYLRWGLLFLSDGKNFQGEQVISKRWVDEIAGKGELTRTCPMRRGCLPGGFGYSAHNWLLPRSDGYIFMGKYGQEVAIFPKSNTVVVLTGASKDPIMKSMYFREIIAAASR